MNTKIAILRGINVGGKRKILMNDLKELFEDLNFSTVTTYIQSGNVIFKSNGDYQKLSEQIENAIKEKFKFDVPVILRDLKELEKSVQLNPFFSKNLDLGELHLTFLKDTPKSEYLKQIETYNFEPDKFKIIGNDIYIYCEGTYHQSKLSNTFFEKKLKIGATTRNWKTILKLVELGNQAK